MYQARDLIEAELLLQRLRDRGITCAVKNVFLQGALGELPLSIRPQVCVLEERDATAAEVCIRDMEAALKAPELPDVVCPRCGDTNPGNFEACWKCGSDLAA